MFHKVVQKGKPLTSAGRYVSSGSLGLYILTLPSSEKVQALSSARADFVRSLEKKFVDDDAKKGLAGPNIHWTRFRSAEFLCIAQCLLVLDRGLDFLPTSNNAVTKWLANEEQLSPQFKAESSATFQTLTEIIDNEECNYVFKHEGRGTMAPAEIVYTVALIALLKVKFDAGASLARLAKFIDWMRIIVRQERDDIRMNSQTVKILGHTVHNLVENGEEWASKFVKNLVPKREDGVDDHPQRRRGGSSSSERQVKTEPDDSDEGLHEVEDEDAHRSKRRCTSSPTEAPVS